LRPGATVEQAQAEAAGVAGRLEQQFPATNTAWSFFVRPLSREVADGGARLALALMTMSVFFVLLMACSNVASLFLVRAEARRREMALRTALGATRLRLVRQLLTEALMLALGGGALGLLITEAMIRTMVSVTGGEIPLFLELRLNTNALLFTLALSCLTPLVFALVPALRTSRSSLRGEIESSGRASRRGLVAVQMAMALVVLVVVGLGARSLAALTGITLGFTAENVLTLRLDLPPSHYPEPHQVKATLESVVERARRIPGIRGAALTSHAPIVGGEPNRTFVIEGREASGETLPLAATVVVSSGFFSTLQIPVLRGRDFTSEEQRSSAAVAVVSHAAQKRYWPGEDPLGARVRLGEGGPALSVVGVVGDLRNPDADQPPEPHVYLALGERPPSEMTLLVRTDSDPVGAAGTLRREVASLAPDVAIHAVRTMERILFEDFAGGYAEVGMMSWFGVVALVLAVAGTYGVVSQAVSRRTREIALRMALGAKSGDVLLMIVRQGATPVLIGVGIGLASALAVSRVMAGLLYGVGPGDPVTYIGGMLLLSSCALGATLAPARRAARIDPMATLRHE